MSAYPEFKVGIVWRGNPRKGNLHLQATDQIRSVSLAQFEPLARQPNVRLVSLQKGFGTEQIAELKDRFSVVDLGSGVNDLMNTAAVMMNLDLIVSVDTAPVHLAGALGVPAWVGLPFVPDWRWLLQREDSPWYPSLRLFRQTRPGEWNDVFARMADSLRLAATR